MNRSHQWSIAAFASFLLCTFPAIAATPSSGTISPSATSVAWDGFPGPAISNDQLNQTSTGDANCTDGTNCDAYTLKLAPGDYTGKRIHFSVTWTSPADDYDVYVHAGAGYGGAIVSQSAGGPPSSIEQNTFD